MLRCRTDFIITTSVDGHLKLWKKQDNGIEFVKHYRAHLAPITGVATSVDGTLFASVAEDGSVKVFDVINFGTIDPMFPSSPIFCLPFKDMINMFALDYRPLTCCWVHRKGQAQAMLAM